MSVAAQVTAPALVVMAMIYSLGPISGAHFNPAVTLAFALRGNFPWRRVLGYWVAQCAGATLRPLCCVVSSACAAHSARPCHMTGRSPH